MTYKCKPPSYRGGCAANSYAAKQTAFKQAFLSRKIFRQDCLLFGGMRLISRTLISGGLRDIISWSTFFLYFPLRTKGHLHFLQPFPATTEKQKRHAANVFQPYRVSHQVLQTIHVASMYFSSRTIANVRLQLAIAVRVAGAEDRIGLDVPCCRVFSGVRRRIRNEGLLRNLIEISNFLLVTPIHGQPYPIPSGHLRGKAKGRMCTAVLMMLISYGHNKEKGAQTSFLLIL